MLRDLNLLSPIPQLRIHPPLAVVTIKRGRWRISEPPGLFGDPDGVENPRRSPER